MNMKIIYNPGKANVVVDALLRQAHESDIAWNTYQVKVDIPNFGTGKFRDEQTCDPEVKKFIDALEYILEVTRRESVAIRWQMEFYTEENPV